MQMQLIRGIQIKAKIQLSLKRWNEYIHLHPYVEDQKKPQNQKEHPKNTTLDA